MPEYPWPAGMILWAAPGLEVRTAPDLNHAVRIGLDSDTGVEISSAPAPCRIVSQGLDIRQQVVQINTNTN